MEPSGPTPKTSWLLGFGVFLGLGYLLFGWAQSRQASTQPIRYNHAVHIANGLACEECHVGARQQEHATLPPLDTCLACHEQALTQNPEEEKIRTLAGAGQMSPWIQITRVPPHVYFSHRRHVTLGGLACADCHGPMETRTEPPRYPFRDLTMDACQACHAQKGVRNDCNDCHR